MIVLTYVQGCPNQFNGVERVEADEQFISLVFEQAPIRHVHHLRREGRKFLFAATADDLYEMLLDENRETDMDRVRRG